MADPQWSSLFLVGGTSVGAVCEELQPVGRTHIGEVQGGLPPVGRTPYWNRGRVGGIFPQGRRSNTDKMW